MWRSRTNSEVSLRNSKTFSVHAFVMMFFPKKVPGHWRWFFPFIFWFRYSDFCRFKFWSYPSGMIIHSPRCRRQKPCLCRCTKILLLCRIHTRRRETFWRQEMGAPTLACWLDAERCAWPWGLQMSPPKNPCGRRMKTVTKPGRLSTGRTSGFFGHWCHVRGQSDDAVESGQTGCLVCGVIAWRLT